MYICGKRKSIAPSSIFKIGYIRIEHETGGAARLAMSEHNSDAIDKVTDARAKKSFEHSEIRIVRTQRADARR